MIIKFFLGLAIIGFTSFCGYFLAKKYRQRKLFFSQFREFNERFIGEITYYRRPLTLFFSQYTYKGEFAFFLQDFVSVIERGRSGIEEILSLSDYVFLLKTEKAFIIDYFLMLGKGDSNSQKGYFSSVKAEIEKMQALSASDCKKYGDLFIKLGFLFGLLVLILIV